MAQRTELNPDSRIVEMLKGVPGGVKSLTPRVEQHQNPLMHPDRAQPGVAHTSGAMEAIRAQRF